MILRFTRHGQPAIKGLKPGQNHELPPGDFPLTELGRKQALHLGRHLADTGFQGKIYSSPYARTAETAAVIARCCNRPVYFIPEIQEIRSSPEPSCPGLTLAQLRRLCPATAPDAELREPWMIVPPEEYSDVARRVYAWVTGLIAFSAPGDDVLLVGHGASNFALRQFCFEHTTEKMVDRLCWNCSLSEFEITSLDAPFRPLHPVCRVDFMPREIITSNLRPYEEGLS